MAMEMEIEFDEENNYWWKIDFDGENRTLTMSDIKDLSVAKFVMSFNLAMYSIPECEEIWKLNLSTHTTK